MQIKYVLARLLKALDNSSDAGGKATESRTIVPVKSGTSAGAPPPVAWSFLKGRGREEQAWVMSDLTLQVKVGHRACLWVLLAWLSSSSLDGPREGCGLGSWQHRIRLIHTILFEHPT
jgi:hypothetical protein